MHGPPIAQRVPTFLLTVPDVEAETVARTLADKNISVWRHNFAYEVGLPEALPFKGEAVRVGIAHYNTIDDIDRLCSALESIVLQR